MIVRHVFVDRGQAAVERLVLERMDDLVRNRAEGVALERGVADQRDGRSFSGVPAAVAVGRKRAEDGGRPVGMVDAKRALEQPEVVGVADLVLVQQGVAGDDAQIVVRDDADRGHRVERQLAPDRRELREAPDPVQLGWSDRVEEALNIVGVRIFTKQREGAAAGQPARVRATPDALVDDGLMMVR